MSTLAVEVCEITCVEKHPNADALDILTIKGWQVVEKRGRFKVGESVVYFQPDSILPKELSDKLNCTQYLAKQRVKPARLRGFVSCGLVGPNEGGWSVGTELTEHYGITKYEPPEPSNHAGLGGQNAREVGPFHYYTNIQNWNNWNTVLLEDEEVIITEKIHGTNWRAGLVDDVFYVGSHHKTKVKDEKIVYWEAALRYNIEEQMRKHLHGRQWVLFGEVFGKVQDLKYGLEGIDLRLFDATKDGSYLDYNDFEKVAEKLQVPTVPLMYRGPYNAKSLAELATGSAFSGSHLKEGVVVRPIKERFHSKLHRVILKKINPEYLVRSKGTEYR